MSKIKHAKPGAAAPQASQLAAVRRLADAGKLLEARQRHAGLCKAYPGFKPLLGLAWEVEWLAGEDIIAAARAWDWQLASPNSRQALEALAESAREAGLAALAGRARQRLGGLESGRTEDAPFDSIDSPFGQLTFEQAQAIDLSRMHLADDRPAAAATVLHGVDHAYAHNYLALAWFESGDLRQALAVADAAWQANVHNLFALDHALRWHCWVGGMEHCAGYRELLRAAAPRRAEDANARIAALRFLGDLEGARRAWDEVEDKDYWKLATELQLDLFEALGDALVSGDEDLAADANTDPDFDDGIDADADADFDEDIDDDIDALTEGSPWFARAWTESLRGIASDSTHTVQVELHPRWNAHLDTCDAHVHYLVRACEIGGAMARGLALTVLKRRAKREDAAARAALTALLDSPHSEDPDRWALLDWIDDEGLHDPAAPVATVPLTRKH